LTFGGSSQGSLGMYKIHERDLLPFHGGFTFLWRNMENANCPTAWPPNPTPPTDAESTDALALRTRKLADTAAAHGTPLKPTVGPVTVTTIVYYYTWPAADTPRRA
jgi:hypothetical protein